MLLFLQAPALAGLAPRTPDPAQGPVRAVGQKLALEQWLVLALGRRLVLVLGRRLVLALGRRLVVIPLARGKVLGASPARGWVRRPRTLMPTLVPQPSLQWRSCC